MILDMNSPATNRIADKYIEAAAVVVLPFWGGYEPKSFRAAKGAGRFISPSCLFLLKSPPFSLSLSLSHTYIYSHRTLKIRWL